MLRRTSSEKEADGRNYAHADIQSDRDGPILIDQHHHPGSYDAFAALLRGYTFVPCGQGCDWLRGRSRDQLVRELSSRIRASDADAARALESPGGKYAMTVVSALMPYPYGEVSTFLVDLVEAAAARSVKVRNQRLAGALVVGFLILIGTSRSGPVTLQGRPPTASAQCP